MSRSLGIPVKLLHEASGHIVTVELKSGELYRGSMIECEDNWNCQLENITHTAKDGKVSQLEHVFVRSSKVRFMVIPDMLKNAPMFKRLESRIKGKGSVLGVGRGRAVAMRARAQAVGRGAAPGIGAMPPVRRSEIENRQIIEKHQMIRNTPSFSGPLMLPNRASGNSLSAPIKSSGGFKDSLEEKSINNLVQIKGRFSVTSENVDLVKDIPSGASSQRTSQEPLRKSASVGNWIVDTKFMPNNQPQKEIVNSNLPASILLPHLQNLFQQTSIQQDLIMSLLSSLQTVEGTDAPQNGKLTALPRGSENDGNIELPVSERERMLLMRISELQSRMISLTDELTAERVKYTQLQQQLNAVSSREREGDS